MQEYNQKLRVIKKKEMTEEHIPKYIKVRKMKNWETKSKNKKVMNCNNLEYRVQN